jgi:sugar/nucleoside kinase (ribokinase family)
LKVAVTGPLCKDRNVISGKDYTRAGGVTYYSGITLGRLGVETVVLGSCGPDFDLWPRNCPTSLVRLDAEGTIQFTNEYHSPDCNERTQRATGPDNSLTVESVDSVWPEGVELTILGPLLHDNIPLELVRHLAGRTELALAAQGVFRYLENNRIVWRCPEAVLALLPFCRYLALDERELMFISGRRVLAEGAAFLLDNGATNLLVTRGSRGSLLFIDGGEFTIPAFPPQSLIDPTGAGDSFLAGYVKALELFDDPGRRGRFAAMTATISLEKSGAFGATADEVLRRLGWQ